MWHGYAAYFVGMYSTIRRTLVFASLLSPQIAVGLCILRGGTLVSPCFKCKKVSTWFISRTLRFVYQYSNEYLRVNIFSTLEVEFRLATQRVKLSEREMKNLAIEHSRIHESPIKQIVSCLILLFFILQEEKSIFH